MTAPKPSLTTTYRRADGELIGDYGWVADAEFFDCEEDPVELVEERWERVAVRRFWHLPSPGGGCEIEDAQPCDEDAEGWWQSPDGVWLRVCAEHRSKVGSSPDLIESP